MTVTLLRTKRVRDNKHSGSDDCLVRECLTGKREAWETLIDKYKNLIFSIPIKYELSKEDAADVFQSVCLSLLSELPRLRHPEALPSWLIQVTSHECLRLRRRQKREPQAAALDEDAGAAPAQMPADLICQLEREQMLREVLSEMSPRCRQLVHMLFFEIPPRPYQEIAARLGLAIGSIGFIRMRCLEYLRRELEKREFQ